MLASIGARHGKSVAQVILRWLIHRGIVVIPKSVRKERMVENFDVFGFELLPPEQKKPNWKRIQLLGYDLYRCDSKDCR